jgi:alkylation response protein AidB-like acyl-CoA dehydrogenase
VKYERFLVAMQAVMALSQAIQVALNYKQSQRQETRIKEAHEMNMKYLEWQMRPYSERFRESFDNLETQKAE